jgi:signal transduction histidine kinase
MRLISEGARQMERILDTLLASARAEANRSRGRCDAVEVAARLATVEHSVALPFVGADEQVVERVLSPLVDNAHRYGEVRIRVTAFEGGVRFEVLDDGPGVPTGEEESVFEPGRRLTAGDGHDGAGLGLALARRLARSAGGDLTCTAGPGGRFVLTLPRA